MNDVVPDRNDTTKNYKNNTWWTLQMGNNHRHGILEIQGTQKVSTWNICQNKIEIDISVFSYNKEQPWICLMNIMT